mmetsp:Transcript_23992/g.74727  ORF Transcript_23992/g.74727 Transcript_23992/m.74727 type:complete len:349 (+) Transcript_23992:357-1403(+)
MANPSHSGPAHPSRAKVWACSLLSKHSPTTPPSCRASRRATVFPTAVPRWPLVGPTAACWPRGGGTSTRPSLTRQWQRVHPFHSRSAPRPSQASTRPWATTCAARTRRARTACGPRWARSSPCCAPATRAGAVTRASRPSFTSAQGSWPGVARARISSRGRATPSSCLPCATTLPPLPSSRPSPPGPSTLPAASSPPEVPSASARSSLPARDLPLRRASRPPRCMGWPRCSTWCTTSRRRRWAPPPRAKAVVARSTSRPTSRPPARRDRRALVAPPARSACHTSACHKARVAVAAVMALTAQRAGHATTWRRSTSCARTRRAAGWARTRRRGTTRCAQSCPSSCLPPT